MDVSNREYFKLDHEELGTIAQFSGEAYIPATWPRAHGSALLSLALNTSDRINNVDVTEVPNYGSGVAYRRAVIEGSGTLGRLIAQLEPEVDVSQDVDTFITDVLKNARPQDS